MQKPADPLRAFLSGTSAKNGRAKPSVYGSSPPIDPTPPEGQSTAEVLHWQRLIAAAVPGLLAQADAIGLRLLAELLAKKDELRSDMPASKLSLIRALLDQFRLTPGSSRRLAAAVQARDDRPDDASGWGAFDAA